MVATLLVKTFDGLFAPVLYVCLRVREYHMSMFSDLGCRTMGISLAVVRERTTLGAFRVFVSCDRFEFTGCSLVGGTKGGGVAGHLRGFDKAAGKNGEGGSVS